MEPRTVEMGELILVGMPCFSNNANREFSRMWKLFMPRMDSIPRMVRSGRSFGVEFYTKEFSQMGM